MSLTTDINYYIDIYTRKNILKIISFFCSLLLLSQQTFGIFSYSFVLAQENPPEAPTITPIEQEKILENINTILPSEITVAPQPTISPQFLEVTINPTPLPTTEITNTPQSEPSLTPSQEPTKEPTVSPTETLSETASPKLTPTVTSAQSELQQAETVFPSMIPTAPEETPSTETQVPTVEPTPTSSTAPAEKMCLTDQQLKETTNDDWTIFAEKSLAETKEKVSLGIRYIFPLENKVTVLFKCLPKDESRRTGLKIQQIKIADLKLPAGTIVNSDYAFDITTGMKDGDFEYEVTLPKPRSKKEVNVTYIEKSAEEAVGQSLDIGELKVITEGKTEGESTIKVENLNHFTIFFVTGGEDKTDLLHPVTLGPSISQLQTSDDIRYETEGYWPAHWLFDFEKKQYLEFTFSPNIPAEATINSVKINFEYQRDPLAIGSSTDVKMKAWNGADFNTEIAGYADLSLSTYNVDETKIINVPLQLVNTPQKVNDFKFRFFFRGQGLCNDCCSTGVKTRHDLVALDVDYSSPGPTCTPTVTPTPTETPVESPTPTPTISETPSVTPTPTETPSETPTSTPTGTPIPTATPTINPQAEIWWYKIDGNLGADESTAGHIVANDTWESIVDGEITGPKNTDVSTEYAFNNPGSYNHIFVNPGETDLSEVSQEGWSLAWGRCHDSTTAVPGGWGSAIDIDQDQEGVQRVFGAKAPESSAEFGPLATSPKYYANITVSAGQRVYCVFYNENLQKSSIGDFVWKDIDDDNIQDPGELGFGSVAVKIYSDNGDGNFDPVTDSLVNTVSTGSDGKYLFNDLSAGTYFVWVDQTTLPSSGAGFDVSQGGSNPQKVVLNAGEENLNIDFGFAPPASISLTKSNDKPNASVGDIVTYTLVIKTSERDLSSMTLVDNLPEGFVYQTGTATVNGGTVVAVEPTLSNSNKTLTWSWSFAPNNSSIIVTYKAKIDSANQAASYTNFAWVSGRGSPRTVESEIVESTVTIGPTYSFSAVAGESRVLGVSTEGEVLAAVLPAAGSETWYLFLALGMIVTGVVIWLFQCHSSESWNLYRFRIKSGMTKKKGREKK